MDNEEKIKELTARIEVLEKAENKRIIKKKLEITWQLIKISIIIILIVIVYIKIKPYKEKIDNVSEKVDKVEKYIDDKITGFKNYFK